jgi:hypothetical protein
MTGITRIDWFSIALSSSLTRSGGTSERTMLLRNHGCERTLRDWQIAFHYQSL